MSLVNQMKSTDVSPRAVVLSLVGFAVVAAGVLFVVMKMVNGSPSGAVSTPASARTRAAAAETRRASPVPTSADYAIIVKRDLFRPAAPPQTAVAAHNVPQQETAPQVVQPTIIPFQPVATAPTAAPVTPPNMAYTGVVEIAGTTYALLENLDTHVSQYTRMGGSAFGWTLTNLAERWVTLESGGTIFTLNIGDNKKDEPTPPPTPAPSANPPTPPNAGQGNIPASAQPPATGGGNTERRWPMRRRGQEG